MEAHTLLTNTSTALTTTMATYYFLPAKAFPCVADAVKGIGCQGLRRGRVVLSSCA